jgi:hypothetical protein
MALRQKARSSSPTFDAFSVWKVSELEADATDVVNSSSPQQCKKPPQKSQDLSRTSAHMPDKQNARTAFTARPFALAESCFSTGSAVS